MRFTHNAIVTANAEALIGWYGRWCKMRLVRDRIEADGTRVAWLAAPERKDLIFVLIETKDPNRVSNPPKSLGEHFGFALVNKSEVDSLRQAMNDAGETVTECEDYGGIVGYLFIAKDPEGRNVEFSFGQDVSEANWDASLA
ncbi:MAG: VOC family protein [Planctomycetes bacterium]|nr:VOC family protein [Planctomycetota bacterium]